MYRCLNSRKSNGSNGRYYGIAACVKDFRKIPAAEGTPQPASSQIQSGQVQDDRFQKVSVVFIHMFMISYLSCNKISGSFYKTIGAQPDFVVFSGNLFLYQSEPHPVSKWAYGVALQNSMDLFGLRPVKVFVNKTSSGSSFFN